MILSTSCLVIMPFIYKLTFSNGKSYVGLTTKDIRSRFKGHKDAAMQGSISPVHKAWRSLGAPSIEALCECDVDCLAEIEIRLIKEHGTLIPNGYNLMVGGEISPMLNPDVAARVAGKKRGSKHSEESKKKMSLSQSGRKHSPETKRKISEAQKGKKVKAASEDTKIKMSLSQKRVWQNPSYREKMSEIRTGKKRGPRSDEEKTLMSANRKGKISPEGEARRKAAQIAAVKGKKLSEEQKLRLSEIRKLWWANKRASM